MCKLWFVLVWTRTMNSVFLDTVSSRTDVTYFITTDIHKLSCAVLTLNGNVFISFSVTGLPWKCFPYHRLVGNDKLVKLCRVMESLMNSAEEQQPSSPRGNSWSKKQESSKSQKPKLVGGFVLVHAGKYTHIYKWNYCKSLFVRNGKQSSA